MLRTINENTIFGVAKSATSYVFLVIFYKLAQPGQIGDYILYDVALAASCLATLGLQSRSYKELDPCGLHLLSLAFHALLPLACLAGWLTGWEMPAILALLVILDRIADVELQGTRQDGHFLLYNSMDLLNQVLTKAGFLLVAMGHALWLPLILLKVAGTLGWLVTRRRRWQGTGFLPTWRGMSSSVHELKEYIGFDVLNYACGHLDLLLLNGVAPQPLLIAYFYVRKFIRLPLVILTYVLDPVYVALRSMADRAAGRRIILRLLAWASWSMLAYAFILVPALAWTSGDPLVMRVAAILLLTTPALTFNRFADLITLLYWPQRQRLLSRSFGTLSNVLVLLLPLLGLPWETALAWIPALTWEATALIVFKVKPGLAAASSLACGVAAYGLVHLIDGATVGPWLLSATDAALLLAALALATLAALAGTGSVRHALNSQESTA